MVFMMSLVIESVGPYVHKNIKYCLLLHVLSLIVLNPCNFKYGIIPTFSNSQIFFYLSLVGGKIRYFIIVNVLLVYTIIHYSQSHNPYIKIHVRSHQNTQFTGSIKDIMFSGDDNSMCVK